MKAYEEPFQDDEVRFLEAAFIDELTEDKEVTLARARGLPLPRWKTYEASTKS